MGVCGKSVSRLSKTFLSCFESAHWSDCREGRFIMSRGRSLIGYACCEAAFRWQTSVKDIEALGQRWNNIPLFSSLLSGNTTFHHIHSLEMLFNPTGLNECLQEWEDLEKDYQQVQVRSLSFSTANQIARQLWTMRSYSFIFIFLIYIIIVFIYKCIEVSLWIVNCIATLQLWALAA